MLKFSKRRAITFVMLLDDGALDRFFHSVDWFGRAIGVELRDSGGILFCKPVSDNNESVRGANGPGTVAVVRYFDHRRMVAGEDPA